MDTITQMTLGAAVGQVTLGKKVGNKALLWGAVAGTIPDLDVLAGPFLDDVSRMAFHRGVTHSLTFAVLFAPLLGYLIYRIHKKREASWRSWTGMVFWAVVTHPLLDNFTSYGTEFFWPFSDLRIAWSTLFVIDPLFTVPLLASVIAILFLPSHSRRRILLNYIGLGVSSAYLLFTVANKQFIEHKFETQLRLQNKTFSRIVTSPTPFNNILWRATAEGGNEYWEGFYSWFDRTGTITFQRIPKNHQAIQHLRNQPAIQKLVWLTNGFYTVEQRNGSLFINDMRYGRLNAWGRVEGEFVFSFRLSETHNPGSPMLLVEREPRAFNLHPDLFQQFGRRLLGN